MTSRGFPKARDILVGIIALAFAFVAWFTTAGLPVPRWEPIGPAAFPRALAIMIVVLVGLLFVESSKRRELSSSSDGAITGQAPAEYTKRPFRAAIAVVTTILGLFGMTLGLIGFRAFAFATFVVIGFVLSGYRWRRMFVLIPVGLLLSFGLHFLFVHVFVTDLP